MSTSDLVRPSGLVAVLGGVLLAVGWIGDSSGADVLFGSLTLAAHVLILLAMVGLYAQVHEKIGWMGQIGFVLTVVGNMLIAAVASVQAYVHTELADVVSDFEVLVEAGPFGAFAPIGGLLFVLGYLLFSIDIVLAAVLCRLAALALIAGAALLFVGASADISSVGIAGAVVFGVALARLGVSLWLADGRAAEEPQPVATGSN